MGPRNDIQGRTGFAHLLEHMMFEGSEHVGEKAHFRYLEACGFEGIYSAVVYREAEAPHFQTILAVGEKAK